MDCTDDEGSLDVPLVHKPKKKVQFTLLEGTALSNKHKNTNTECSITAFQLLDAFGLLVLWNCGAGKVGELYGFVPHSRLS